MTLFQIKKQLQFTLLLMLAIGTTATIAASSLQSHKTIKEAAKRYLESLNSNYGGNINITIGRLDSRLRLNQCTQKLTIFTPPGRQTTGKTTVGIRCEDGKPWTIYISAQVGILEKVVIASRNLSRGTHLTPDDLHLEERDITQLHRGYLTKISQAVDKTITRMVRQGTPLAPHKINAMNAVKRGANITILSTIGSIEVRVKGVALESGAVGERIKVKNSRSKRHLYAQIISSTLVKVEP